MDRDRRPDLVVPPRHIADRDEPVVPRLQGPEFAVADLPPPVHELAAVEGLLGAGPIGGVGQRPPRPAGRVQRHVERGLRAGAVHDPDAHRVLTGPETTPIKLKTEIAIALQSEGRGTDRRRKPPAAVERVAHAVDPGGGGRPAQHADRARGIAHTPDGLPGAPPDIDRDAVFPVRVIRHGLLRRRVRIGPPGFGPGADSADDRRRLGTV